MKGFLPAGEIGNECPECAGKNKPGEPFYACGSCFGSGRDQTRCIVDTIPVTGRAAGGDVVLPAGEAGPVDIDAVRAGFMAASLERNRKAQKLLVYQLVLVLPRALDEIGESRVELNDLRAELEQLRAENRMLKSIVRIHVPPTKEIEKERTTS